jgi:Tat protein translocase TatB subunit
VVLLILESLGSTELLFILVMALVFFGPRKLPQLSRSLGKNLAEFRKASEDFKHTWEKEVNFEETERPASPVSQTLLPSEVGSPENSIMKPPTIEAITPDRVIARSPRAAEVPLNDAPEPALAPVTAAHEETQPTAKHDWL